MWDSEMRFQLAQSGVLGGLRWGDGLAGSTTHVMIGPHLAFFPPCLAADLLRLGWAAGNQLPCLMASVFSGRGGGGAGGRWNCLAVAGGKLSRSLLLIR